MYSHLGLRRFAVLGLSAAVVCLLAAGCGTSTTATTPKKIDIAPDITDDSSNIDEDADGGGGTDTSSGDTKSDAGCAQDKDCPVTAAQSAQCLTGKCAAGKCTTQTAADGATCDDKLDCTASDVCSAGVCKGKEDCSKFPKGDPKEGQDIGLCRKGSCDDSGKCMIVTNDDVPCDDGDACTVGDYCKFGACLTGPTQADCNDANDCTIDACNPGGKDAGCSHEAKAVGAACQNASDLCHTQQACEGQGTAVQCAGGVTEACDDGNTCTGDSCVAATGCKHAVKSNGTGCDDADPCTTDEVCAGGVCKGLAKSCDDANACTSDLCDDKTGECQHVAQTNLPCDDGKPCTKNDMCDAGTCKGANLQCNDANPCTSDECDPKTGTCTYTALTDGAACTDASLCTSNDQCKSGKCQGTDWLVSGQCDDKNDCTTDGCQKISGCLHVPADAKTCDDGDPCTTLDKCASTTCKGVAKDCADTNKCTSDSCDTTSGACKHTQFIGPCDDGNKCTSNDQCQDGACAGTATNCDDNNSCTSDMCDTLKGCIHKLNAGGTPCDDGLPCTVGDKCDGGQCVPTTNKCVTCTGAADIKCKAMDDNNVCNGIWKCLPYGVKQFCGVDQTTVITCDGSKDNPCSKNTCNQSSGVCAVIVKNEGTPCSTGSKCVEGETCSTKGSCQGIAVDCNDSEPCTQDACDATQGCTHAVLANATVCDDGNSCTGTDSCVGGKCQGTSTCNCTVDADCLQYDDGDLCNGVLKCTAGVCIPAPETIVTCPALKNEPCKSNICSPSSGACIATSKADAVMCSDSNACTVGDACQSGVCVAPKALNCDDANKCTVDVCDPVFGCDHAPLSLGALCDDGNACTATDTCVAGVCAGKPLNCDDANACTTDLCSSTTGCTSIIDDTNVCDDNNPCTVGDLCLDGLCKGPGLNCDDKNPCTIDACDGKGGCKNVVTPGKDCDDGDKCTQYDTCIGSACVGKARNCDDGNPCTTDACQLDACVSYPAAGKTCDDGNSCTTGDVCDLQATCAGKMLDCTSANACVQALGCSPVTGCITAPNDAKPCNDNDMCTLGDVCASGVCAGSPLSCNDNNICTAESCDAKVGCVVKAANCDDKNDCTLDGCAAGVGCTHESQEGTKCEDGDQCTIKGQCSQGACVSQPQKCDDGNPCTVDSCDSKTGCIYLPAADTAATCDDGNLCTVDSCHNGACVGTAKTCDDGNPCTIDTCNPTKGCVTSDSPNGQTCNDADSCTCDSGDTDAVCAGKTASKCNGGICGGGYIKCYACPNGLDSDCTQWDNNNKCDGILTCSKKNVTDKGGLCRAQPPVVCSTLKDTPCNRNTCDVLTGSCSMKDLENDMPCQDGLGCTSGDRCINGGCVPTGPTDCSAKADQCNTAKCLEDPIAPNGHTCVSLPKDGTPVCDADGNGCTANDSCVAGKCVVGGAIDCTGIAGACQVSACKSTGAMSFQCTIAPQPNGTVCSDHQLCTEGDTCLNGQCKAGTKPHDCSSYTGTCATGICDKTANAGQGACIGQAQNQGQPCDADSNGCTVGDVCLAGMCIPGGPPDCSNLTAACAIGACKSTGNAAFQCVGTARPDSLPCEADSNGCTVGDACKSGKCTAGTPLSCSNLTSPDGCLVGTCKSLGPSNGICYAIAAPVGQSCDSDKNGCTKGDYCNTDGACLPGPAVDCVAYTGSCTVGFCKSSGSSTFACNGDPKAEGTVCDADGNGCTMGDTCKAGKCTTGTSVVCPGTPGPCLAETCLSKSADTFQCQPEPASPGKSCDADANGCTVGDTCQNGSCTPGPQELCTQFQTECGSAVCKNLSASTNTCDITAKLSYPPINATCKPGLIPTDCPTGYQCFQDDKTGLTGHCKPGITVPCDDKNGCTVGDYCFAGACVSGAAKDCDDDDPCTLDSCAANACVHTTVAGCTTCVSQTFDAAILADGAVVSTDATYVKWQLSDAAPWAGMRSLHAEWQGASSSTFAATARYLHRRIYVDEGGAPALDFHVAMAVGDQGCGSDDLTVTINGNVAWQQCDSITSAEFNSFKHVTVDLKPYAGAPADIEFRVTAGIAGSSAGSIDIDSVRVTGACGNDCLGADFEQRVTTEDPDSIPLGVLPQPWQFTSTNKSYVQWAVNPTDGHTGKAEIQATYAGAPGGGTAQSAQFTIPSVRATAGDKLRFAVRAPSVGDAACGNDDLTVRIAGTQVYQLCKAQATWALISIDLTPYVGQTVDIEFSATTGGTSAAQGNFELDDIAVQGNCTYACFQDGFDTAAGMGGWTATTTDTKLKWGLASNDSSSPPNAVFLSHDATPKDNAVAFLTAKPTGRFTLPVLGATFKYSANVFLKNAACPADTIMALRLITQATQGTTLPALATDGNVTLKSHCMSSVGWQSFEGTVDAAASGLDVTPSLSFGKLPANTASTAYVDDITLMCK